MVSQEPNYTLVPEVPFPLDGGNGFLTHLENRMRRRHHAVIVVAEGAGQHLFQDADQRQDASGNVQHQDIGPFLSTQIKAHFARRNFPINLKYLDPSYYIRSVPANSRDCILSDQMARHAVHAALAGADETCGLDPRGRRWNQIPKTLENRNIKFREEFGREEERTILEHCALLMKQMGYGEKA